MRENFLAIMPPVTLKVLGGLIILGGLAVLIRIESRQRPADNEQTSNAGLSNSSESSQDDRDTTKESCLAASSPEN